MKKTAYLFFIIISICLSVKSFAQEAKQDFTLVNKTGIEIHRVYISAHSSADWGDDILGKKVMAVDEEWGLQFEPKENVCDWDLRIEDKDGTFVEWENIDLCKNTKITLHYDGKDATVTFE